MRKETLKKLIILLVAILIFVGGTILIINFSNSLGDKKIEKLKTSFITYLGKDEDGKYVYIDNEGKTLVFDGYTSMQDFSYDTANVRKEGLEGVISKNNKVIVDFGKYYDISDNRVCGSYVVENEQNKYGLISYNGKVILDTIYDRITTFGEDVPVFKVQYNDIYYIATVSEKLIYETKNSAIDIKFGEKLFKNTDKGLVKVIDGEDEFIFDVGTGKQIYYGKGLDVFNNVIKDTENNKFILIDQNGNEKLNIDYIAGEESFDIKLDKYVVIESKSGFYEIYDKNFELITTTERKPAFFKTYKDEYYIINNVEGGIEIYKDVKLYKTLSGYEYDRENMVEYGSMFGLKNIETEKIDIFDFELNKLKEGVLLDKIYPKFVLLVDSDSNKIAFTSSKEEVRLGNDISIHALNTNSAFNDYIVISKSNDDIYEIIDLKGNSVIKNIENIEVLLDNHILITDKSKGDMYLFNVASNKEIFRFEKDNYDKAYENVQAIKLKTGYFNYKGEQIARLDEE